MTKKELFAYFIKENHTLSQCAKHFNCSVSKVRRALKKYDIKKEQEIKINYNSLYKFYVVENHTFLETTKHFSVSKTCLYSKLKDFHIVKTSRKKKASKEDIIKYYINENLTSSEVASKLNCSKKTILKRLREFNIKKNKKDRCKNVFSSFKSKYGVEHPSQCETFKNKMIRTNQEKYGVPFACMREECRKYSGNNSKPNQHFANILKKNGIKFEREFSLGNYSYDFKVGKYLFEINPSVFHNSTFSPVGVPKDKMYHAEKSDFARKNGYHCIHVWDWDEVEKIVSLFLKDKQRVYARNCSIKEVSLNDAKKFINTYHLQGYAKDKIRIGLYYDNDLVSLMTFDKPRYNKNYQYELVRYCSNKNVVGGSEKLLSYFIGQYGSSIVSYCDLSKFDGEVYNKLGFVALPNTKVSAHWYNCKTKQHITDNLVRQKGFDILFGTNYGKGTNNEELMIKNGFVKIYDCGQATFIFSNI